MAVAEWSGVCSGWLGVQLQRSAPRLMKMLGHELLLVALVVASALIVRSLGKVGRFDAGHERHCTAART